MVSELSFLIELLLNHDLPKPTKDLIANRIKEVEGRINDFSAKSNLSLVMPSTSSFSNPNLGSVNPKLAQAPSTLAAMARHGDIPSAPPPVETPVPVEQIAQTPIAAAALAHRAEMMAKGNDVVPGSKVKRKW